VKSRFSLSKYLLKIDDSALDGTHSFLVMLGIVCDVSRHGAAGGVPHYLADAGLVDVCFGL